MASVYKESIEPNLEPGNTLMFALVQHPLPNNYSSR